MASFTINVNGTPRTVEADANEYLLYILRDKLDLTGPKYGCGVGVCGACTCSSSSPIMKSDGSGPGYDADSRFSGTAVVTPRTKFRSCVTRIGQVGTREITTIEGLGATAVGAKLQASWKKFDVAQCGFCQAGQLMTAYELLSRPGIGVPTDEQIDAAMQANLCRCGTYPRIRAAIKDAAA